MEGAMPLPPKSPLAAALSSAQFWDGPEFTRSFPSPAQLQHDVRAAIKVGGDETVEDQITRAMKAVADWGWIHSWQQSQCVARMLRVARKVRENVVTKGAKSMCRTARMPAEIKGHLTHTEVSGWMPGIDYRNSGATGGDGTTKPKKPRAKRRPTQALVPPVPQPEKLDLAG